MVLFHIHLIVREAVPLLDELQGKLNAICIDENQQDMLKFSLSENGKFSTKLYAKHILPQGKKRAWARLIWHTTLPPEVVTFLWKLIRHALPVDSRISTKGVYMASKCRCCKTFSQETISHLFLHSEVAREVWRCFGEIFRQPLQFYSIGQVLRIWMPKLGPLPQFDFIKAGIAAFALWELWVSRCDATYDGRQMNAIANLHESDC